jgi:Icc-related predicted phosphoesterase
MKITYLIIALVITIVSCKKEEDLLSQDELTVKITEPTNHEPLGINQGLTFKGVVSGIVSSSTDLTLLNAQWISGKDGLIFESNLNGLGITTFTTTELSKNIHQITLNVTKLDGSIISDNINIYNAIKLLPIEKTNNSSTLTWCSIQDSNFQSFELYRSTSESSILQNTPIYVTNNIQDSTFVDTTAILGQEYFYKVFLNRTSATPAILESNFQSIVAGEFIDTDYPILKILSDNARNYAYAIVNTRTNGYTNPTGYGLAFINLNNFEIDSRILQNVRFSDIDIDPSGNYLYACSRSSTIHKINLNTKTLESTFTVSNSAHKIEVGTNNKLYYHITPPTSGSTEFRIYDLSNYLNTPFSTTIPAAYSSFSHGDFEIDPNNNLFHGGSNSTSPRISKIGTTNNTFSLTNQLVGNSSSRVRTIFNNNKIYWNYRVYDIDLNPIGMFQGNFGNENICDVSPNGNCALGWSNLFNSNNQTILKNIPANYESGVFTNNNQLLIYQNYNPLFQQYESKIYLYNL